MKDNELNDKIKKAFADVKPSAELEVKAKRLALKSRLDKLRLTLAVQIAAAAVFLVVFTRLPVFSASNAALPQGDGVDYVSVASVFGNGTVYTIAAGIFVALCALFIALYFRNKNKLK